MSGTEVADGSLMAKVPTGEPAQLDKHDIDTLRQFCGTLPARTTDEDWLEPTYVRGIAEMKIIPVSPKPRASVVLDIYKGMFEGATSTWGDANLEGNWPEKWEHADPAARYMVVWNAFQRNTLPMIFEDPTFQVQIVGGPRHFFDQYARTRVGANFKSIGCRDNSKMPAEFVLYSNLYDMMMNPETPEQEKVAELLPAAFKACKAAYKAILDCGQGSYQIGRSILPMSYHHQFSAGYNMAALMGTFFRRSCLGEEEFAVAAAFMLRKMLVEEYGLNMVGQALKPPCYRSKRCHYAGSMNGFGGLMFSNLFSPSDPICKKFLPKDYPGYSEFNESCTDSQELIRHQVGFMKPEDYIDLPPEYELAKQYLSEWEIAAFES